MYWSGTAFADPSVADAFSTFFYLDSRSLCLLTSPATISRPEVGNFLLARKPGRPRDRKLLTGPATRPAHSLPANSTGKKRQTERDGELCTVVVMELS